MNYDRICILWRSTAQQKLPYLIVRQSVYFRNVIHDLGTFYLNTDYGSGWTIWGLIPGRAKRFFSPRKRPGDHPVSYSLGSEDLFPRGKQSSV